MEGRVLLCCMLSLALGFCGEGVCPLRCQQATALLAAWGGRGLPAAPCQESKRDGMRVLTDLTQFIWKISGENTSNKDRNSDSVEQAWISVRDKQLEEEQPCLLPAGFSCKCIPELKDSVLVTVCSWLADSN